MASADRPLMSVQQIVLELVREAEGHNVETCWVSTEQWLVLDQYPKSRRGRDADGKFIVVEGWKFRRKAPATRPHGSLDMSSGEAGHYEP
jgi:hypothetical protein